MRSEKMKKALVATAFVLVMLAATSITSLADVVCINAASGSTRLVLDCSECRSNEDCGAIVTAPQQCESGEAVIGFNASGTIICDQFSQPGCTVESEICDYIDNDCDGEVDEGFTDLNTLCSVGIGACERAGIFICSDGGSGTECSVIQGDPVPEVCNDNVDNDCDGEVDEGDCTTEPIIIGTFGAAEPIDDTIGLSLAEGESEFYQITFTTSVLLSGTLTVNTTGDPDLIIRDGEAVVLDSSNFGDESFDLALEQGTYVIEVIAATSLDGYTLSLLTTAP